MDTLKLAILAFIAGGIVLYMADVSIERSILISAVVCTIFTTIAVIRHKNHPPRKQKKQPPEGPTIR